MSGNVSKNDTPLPALTANQEKAVRLVFGGKLTDDEVAAALGIEPRTLYRWKALPAWKKRLDELRAQLREELGRGGIADQLERLKRRDARWKRNNDLVDRRAERFTPKPKSKKKDADDEDEDDKPAADADDVCDLELATGLYKKKIFRRYDKETGAVASEEIEPVFDTGLYRALHDDEKLTAQELGELVTKAELSGPGGKPIQMQMDVNIVGYSHGGIADALRYWLELAEVGRLPNNREEAQEILKELDAREEAIRKGKPVPPLNEPYIPALDALLEQEDAD